MTNTTMSSGPMKHDAVPASNELTSTDLDGLAGGGAATPAPAAATVKFKEFTVKKTTDNANPI